MERPELRFSEICSSVVGFVAFCTRHGSIPGYDFGSLQASLTAVFVSSRNALPKNMQLRGRLPRAQKIYKPLLREAFGLASLGIMKNPV